MSYVLVLSRNHYAFEELRTIAACDFPVTFDSSNRNAWHAIREIHMEFSQHFSERGVLARVDQPMRARCANAKALLFARVDRLNEVLRCLPDGAIVEGNTQDFYRRDAVHVALRKCWGGHEH